MIEPNNIEFSENDIIRLTNNNYNSLKQFIISNHNELLNQDQFIIDDIEELRDLFNEEKGFVLGIMLGEKIIASIAMDFNNDKLGFSDIVNKSVSQRGIVEIGWIMVDKQYRGHNISKKMISIAESYVWHTMPQKAILATVHPQNFAMLNVFLCLGYLQFNKIVHFGKDRLILLKC